MKRQMIAAMIIWACVGFNSAADVTAFLNTPSNIFFGETSDHAPKNAQIVAMPTGSDPMFEVFFKTSDKSFSASQVTNGIECSPLN
jgi:hypothetical protein